MENMQFVEISIGTEMKVQCVFSSSLINKVWRCNFLFLLILEVFSGINYSASVHLI